MRPAPWKVGELAKRTGVSVRTLHYYDEIGLLTPSHHSEAGYRLYTESDVVRLQQIKSLRSLGWSLDEVRECLKSPNFAPQRVVELHLALVREQIELQERLRDRLEGIAKSLRSAETVSVEDFLQTIEVITMLDKYYTPEQRKELEERRQTVGDERIRQVEGEWKELMEQVRAEMEKGTNPASETVQALARRWMGLVREFTGENPGIEKSLGTMYQQETTVHGMDTGPMKEMMAYIQKAMEAGKKPQ
jgi:MerR family transcriptional regulator, thiopeptide resistance regulator